jgi:uncharacterized protein (TIGR00661 family)
VGAVRILYGVVGEGMGHAVRSGVVLDHLVDRHEVRVVASGRARAYLAERFPDVREIWGLTLAYADNEVRRLETVAQNVRGAVSGWPANVREFLRAGAEFAPDVVVSDFETLAWLVGRTRRVPVISLDNMQIIDRCRLDPEIVRAHRRDYVVARQIVRMKLPGAFHYLVTTFFRPPLRRERTTLVPPVLRREILQARAEPGEHLLVYQTAEGNDELPRALAGTGLPCRVYGFRRDLERDETQGRITFRPFSETRFVEDLRTARAVIAGGSFTLMGEALQLGKPMLSVPIADHFEQILNARYLERLGYGGYAPAATPVALGAFLERLPEHELALAGYRRADNAELLAALDARLEAARAVSGDWTLAEAFR